jgi:hypothetical protein
MISRLASVKWAIFGVLKSIFDDENQLPVSSLREELQQ